MNKLQRAKSDGTSTEGIGNNTNSDPFTLDRDYTVTQPLLNVYISPYFDIPKEEPDLGTVGLTKHGRRTG